MNRYWQEVFGAGLVHPAGDFGVTGELPSHPELLDWLAVEFREKNWDIKQFFKLLVTSATYARRPLPHQKSSRKTRRIAYCRAGLVSAWMPKWSAIMSWEPREFWCRKSVAPACGLINRWRLGSGRDDRQ